MQMTLSAYGEVRGYKRRRPKLGRILIVGAPSRQKGLSASQRRSTDGVFCPASGLRLYAHPLFFLAASTRLRIFAHARMDILYRNLRCSTIGFMTVCRW